MTIVPITTGSERSAPPASPPGLASQGAVPVTITATSAKPESMGDLIDAVSRNHEGIGHLIDRFGAQFTRARDAQMSISKTFAWMVFAFMIGTVGVCGWLVYAGRMSDGALTFLLGVMVAYMMRFIDRLDLGGNDG